MVLMAVVDPNCKFIAVDIGAYGSNSDSGIWKHSNIAQMLEGPLQLPGEARIAGTNFILHHVLLGDEAFQLTPTILRRFPSRVLTPIKRIFNYRLSRARYIINFWPIEISN